MTSAPHYTRSLCPKHGGWAPAGPTCAGCWYADRRAKAALIDIIAPQFSRARQDRVDADLATPKTSLEERFTCRQCGEHRDTTLQGHCDDCES